MPVKPADIDKLLATALRGEDAAWPAGWDKAVAGVVIERINYHGIDGLIVDAPARGGWPKTVAQAIRHQAIARAMWDMRHHQLLGELLEQLSARGIRHVLLKGTAVAYLLYAVPSQRGRADSDLLVDPRQVAATRRTLRELGYQPSLGEVADLDAGLQEGWHLSHGDGSVHHIDLHWQAINSRALRHLMPVTDFLDQSIPLERLSPEARTVELARLLLHTCLHRLMHRTAPYIVNGKRYYGGERLIWAEDIGLLTASLDDAQWRRFADLAIAAEVAPVCLDAFDYAERTVAADVPADIRTRLLAARSDSRASRYLLKSGRKRRMLSNLWSGGGVRAAFTFARTQLFPPAETLRAYYPGSADRTVPRLLVRRWADFLLPSTRARD